MNLRDSVSDFCKFVIEGFSSRQDTNDSINIAIETLNNLIIKFSSFLSDFSHEFYNEYIAVIEKYIEIYDINTEIEKLVLLNFELISIFGKKCQITFLNTLVDTIQCACDKRDAFYPKYLEDVESKKIPTEFSSKSSKVFLFVLKHFLCRFSYRNDDVYMLLCTMLFASNPPFQQRDVLSCMCYSAPQHESQAWMLISSLCVFVKNNSAIFNECKDADSLCGEAIKRLTKRVSKIVFDNIGKNIISFMNDFTQIADSTPIFLENYFDVIYRFIRDDYYIALLCLSLFLKKFKNYFKISSFLEICRYLTTVKKTFWKELCRKYGENPAYFISLQKINQEFVPSFSKTDIPPIILLELLMNQKNPEEEDVNLVFGELDKILAEESFEFTYDHFLFFYKHNSNIAMYLKNFDSHLIIKVLTEHPEIATETFIQQVLENAMNDQNKRNDINLCRVIYLFLCKMNFPDFPGVEHINGMVESDKNSPFDIDLEYPIHKVDTFLELIEDSDDFVMELQSVHFSDLFKNDNCNNLIHVLLDKKPYRFIVLSSLIEAIAKADAYSASNAYRALISYPKLREMWHENKCEVEKELIKLHNINVNNFIPVCRALCNHEDFSKIDALQIAPYISDLDTKTINEFFHVDNTDSLCEDAKSFIKRSLPTLLMYVTMTENENWANIVAKLIELIYEGDDSSRISSFFADTLPFICGDLMRMCVSESIEGQTRVNIKENIEKIEEILQTNFYLSYIQYALDSFREILHLGYSDLDDEVINALSESIDKIGNEMNKYYYSFFLILQLAMEKQDLVSRCLELWSKILRYINNQNAIEFLFYPILLYTLNFYNENQEAAEEIMNILILQPQFDTSNLLEMFSGIKISDKLDKFFEIKHINRETQPSKTLQTLADKLMNSPHVICKIQLNLILDLLKNNTESSQSKQFIEKLLSFLTTDISNDCKILACRCLSQVSVDDISTMEIAPIFSYENHVQLLENVVKNVLIPLLNDPVVDHYKIIAFSIQNALSAEELKIDEKTLDLIKPLLDVTYTCNDPREPNPDNEKEIPYYIINTMHKLHNEIIKDDNCILYKILPACSVSPLLCRLLFSPLLSMDINNEDFRERIRVILEKHLVESPTSVKSFILSSYTSLIELNINMGQSVNIKDFNNTNTINIGIKEEVIVDAAIDCGMYALALKHLNFMERNEKFNAKAQLIYENLDDEDELEYISRNDKQQSEDSIVSDPKQSIESKVKALNNMIAQGLYKKALNIASNIKKASVCSQDIDEVIAKAALRLQDWETMKVLTKENTAESFDNSIAKALSFLDQRSIPLFNKEITTLRKNLAKDVDKAVNCSVEHIFNEVCKFRIVEDIEDASKGNTKTLNYYNHKNLELAEIETAVNCAIQDIVSSSSFEETNKKKAKTWLALEKMCRKSGKIEKAKVLCDFAIKCSPLDDAELIIERSKVLWENGEKKDAISLLETKQDDKTFTEALLYKQAKIAQITESAPFAKIKSMYEESIKLNENNGSAYYQLASICDDALNSNVSIISDCMVKEQITRTSQVFGKRLEDPNIILDNFKEWIISALDNYFTAISLKESLGVDIIPRIFSIFFDVGAKIMNAIREAKEKQTNGKNTFIYDKQTKLNNIIMTMFDVVSKHIGSVSRFVLSSAVTQIISRIYCCEKELVNFLYVMIENALSEYTDNVLWNIMYLKLIDNPLNNAQFWDIESCQKKINTFQNVTKALLNLTTVDVLTAKQDEPKIRAFRESLNNCDIMVPTRSNFLSKSLERPVIVGVEEYISQYPSKQKPKIFWLVSNDGESTKFLLKKDKDMRKDMRMMEFCNYVNIMYKRNKRTRQRNFNIMTYSVVCLNNEVSLIEWVPNTVTLFRLLGHESGSKRKLEYTNISRLPAEQRVEKFIETEKMYKPKTKEWFAISFPSPTKWFKAQQEYIHSSAVWSIVGYIVGLGDRHLFNILVSKETGAAVHVDFDLLFDKSKTNNCPENVPFRLTQCVIDGLGINGINGSFPSSCTLALETLRTNKKKLLNVLKTFIYDPLSAVSLQDKEISFNEVDRRVSCVSKDDGSVVTSDVEVQMLIDQATDKANLSLMFCGWEPYI